MKARELAELLLQHPDFEVEGISETFNLQFGNYPIYTNFTIDGIADIGHSDKVIILDCNLK